MPNTATETSPVALLIEGDYFSFNKRLCCVMEITEDIYTIEDCRTNEVLELTINQFEQLKGVKRVRVRSN
jgi:hypothetical protein